MAFFALAHRYRAFKTFDVAGLRIADAMTTAPSVSKSLRFVDSVRKLLSGNSLNEKLSEGAINFAKTHLNWEENTKLLKSFYEKIG